MRAVIGAAAGLIIGVALAFTLLAVAAMSPPPAVAACVPAMPPSAWLIEVQVPWTDVQAQVASGAVEVAGGMLRTIELKPGPCGQAEVKAQWEGPGVTLGGLGLTLQASGDGRQLLPRRLAWGRLEASVDSLPEEWQRLLARPVMSAAAEALAGSLHSEDMELCGLVGYQEGLTLYLCGAGD